jgi:hypothetical protein
MAAAVFEARYDRILRSRAEGYEELEDHLGRKNGFGSLVRLGILRRRERNVDFQRYHGYVPTVAGEAYLEYLPDEELILVRPGCAGKLKRLLDKDPAPNAPFKPTYAEPTAEQFDAVRHMLEQAGRDVWRVQRAEHLRGCILRGYMDLRSFTKRTGIGEGTLLRLELVVPREERPHDRALHLELTDAGSHYLEVADPWELLLVRPGMELPLLLACDADKAAYWCGLP